VKGDLTIWEAYGVVNSQFFFVQNFTQMWKTLWGTIPTKAFLLKIIWKNSPIGAKNKSNETYIKGFCEKEKCTKGAGFQGFFLLKLQYVDNRL
jgi:hypothetical protein